MKKIIPGKTTITLDHTRNTGLSRLLNALNYRSLFLENISETEFGSGAFEGKLDGWFVGRYCSKSRSKLDNGVLDAAVLGSASFDIEEISGKDPKTVSLCREGTD